MNEVDGMKRKVYYSTQRRLCDA